MKKLWTLLFIISGCVAKKAPVKTSDRLVKVYTLAEATKLIDSLLGLVVRLPPGSVIKNPDGTQSMSKTFEIDSVIVSNKDKRLWIGIKKDTTDPHDGNDTLIPDPNQRRK